MKLVNLSLYAEGYYSGRTYEENRWVKADSYEKIKGDLTEDIFCGELDGKHSQTYGEIEAQDWFANDDDLVKAGDGVCEGEQLRNELVEIYKKHNLDFETEEKEVAKYLESLDRYIDVTVSVLQSQKDELDSFIDNLAKSAYQRKQTKE